MARNVKFPLKMADGEEVRTLEEFKMPRAYSLLSQWI